MWVLDNPRSANVIIRQAPFGCDIEQEELLNFLASPYYKIYFKRPVTVQVCRSVEGDYIARVLEHPWWEGSGETPLEAKNSLVDYIYGAWLLAEMPDEELGEGARDEKRAVLYYIERAEER